MPAASRIFPGPPPREELVIRGQVTLVGKDGSVQTFVEGDSFTMEAGWAGEWRVDKPFMKYFALSAPRR
jgi:uncharacterized protein